MNKNFYKLKLWIYKEENDDNIWVDFFLDVRKIIGWYIPPTIEEEISGEKSPAIVHIYVNGDVFSVKQEPHIKEYLLKECYSTQ